MRVKDTSKTDLSRRDFLKATTAATAGASVGLAACGATASTLAGPSVAPEWAITDREILTLWTNIWPKIVALSWLDVSVPGSPTNYRETFENNEAFRIREVHRIGNIIYNNDITNSLYVSNIPIKISDPPSLGIAMSNYIGFYHEFVRELQPESLCPLPQHDDVYGDTYFMINKDGIIMPWPEKPILDEIFVGYYQGGGVIPRARPDWITDPASPESQLFNAFINVPASPAAGAATTFTLDGLSGVALIHLFEKWPKTIAEAWHICEILSPTACADKRSDIITNLQKYVMPEVWTKWPAHANPRVEERGGMLQPLPHGTNQSTASPNDFILSHPPTVNMIDLIIPLPPRPTPPPALTEEKIIFQELILGYASNPMYSNCYG